MLTRSTTSQSELAKRLMNAVKRDGEKPAIERWKALIARGAIDVKGRVLLKAPRPFGKD